MGPFRPIVGALLDRAVDDAALLCQARLGMHEAIDRDLDARAGPFGRTVGHFVVPISRIGELSEANSEQLPTLNAVIDRHIQEALATIDSSNRLRIASVDTPQGVNVGKGEMLDELIAWSKTRGGRHDVYCEIFGGNSQPENIDEMVEHLAIVRGEQKNFGAKVSTRGVKPELIAHALAACSAHHVPFKATADLAEPITKNDGSAPSYGFLNLMTATLVAFRDADAHETIVQALEENDAGAFAFDEDVFTWQERDFGAATISAMRLELFVAFASCDPTGPAVHLGELGFLP